MRHKLKYPILYILILGFFSFNFIFTGRDQQLSNVEKSDFSATNYTQNPPDLRIKSPVQEILTESEPTKELASPNVDRNISANSQSKNTALEQGPKEIKKESSLLPDSNNLSSPAVINQTSGTNADKPEESEDLYGEEHDHHHDADEIKIDYQSDRIIAPSNPTTNAEYKFGEVLPLNTSLTGFTVSSIPNNSSSVSTTGSFNLTFASTPDTSLINNLKFYPEAKFSKVLNGNTLTVRPERLQRQTEYVFGLRGLQICNSQKCSEKEEIWYYAVRFRTDVKEVKSIGRTIENRDILAYYYGKRTNLTGKKILLTGAIHGEEWRSGGLWMLVDHLNKNPNEIDSKNKEIIIVPEVNIDGALRNKSTGNPMSQYGRYNSRSVNLNRNFPIQWKGCNVCGVSSNSEPETQAIVNLTMAEKPSHLITYHAQWPENGMIFLGSDTSLNTRGFAYWVANRSGYPVGIYDGPEVQGGGDVPGDQAVWSESVGTTSILIEASYRSRTDWDKNFPMYLGLLRDF